MFDNFDKIFNYLIMNARFVSIIDDTMQVITCLGVDHASYYLNSCLCQEHLNMLSQVSRLPLSKMVGTNIPDIAPHSVIQAVMKEYEDLIKPPVDPERLIEFICKDERFFLRLVNAILRTNNMNFYRYITDFLINYQKYFRIENSEEDPNAPSLEIFTKFNVKPELVPNFQKYWEKGKYYFFPGVMSGTMNRKSMIGLSGNIQINISIQPDFIYMGKTLFTKKKNTLAPKLI